LWALPVALGVASGVFFFIHLLPGDPIDLMLGEMAAEANRTALREALHLDEPILKQYGRYMTLLIQGDFGQSLSMKQPVLTVILARYPATLQLSLAALLIALFLAIPLGLLAALRKGIGTDRGILLFSLIGVATPNFLLGPILILFFSLKMDWLPVSGKAGLASLILPALTLGIGMSAILVRMTRSSVLSVIGKEFILTAQAKGIPTRWIVIRHLFRNALMPIITLVGLQLGALLTGSIITETLFSWPGLGRLTISAILSRDYPLVQGCVLVVALTYLMISLLVDLMYAVIDPRVRYS
jgi:peptide/nickel transport system permease protein